MNGTRERWLIWTATAVILLACAYGCMAVDPHKGRGLHESRPRARPESPAAATPSPPPAMPSFEDLLGNSPSPPPAEPAEEVAEVVDESNSTRPAEVEQPNLAPTVRRSAVGRVLPVVFMAVGLAAVAWMRARSRERTDGQIEGSAAADSVARPGG